MNAEDLSRLTPVEQIDDFMWTARRKIIPRSVHGVHGLANISHSSLLSSSPATPFHYHHNILEVFCIAKGRRECTVYDGSEAICYECTGNEALLIFPDEPHISGSNGIDPCDMFALQLDLSDRDDFLGLNPEAGRRLCRSLLGLRQRHITMSPIAFDLLKCAFDSFTSMNRDAFDEGAMYLIGFLCTLVHLPSVNAVTTEAPNDRIRRVLDYISENIAQPLTLAQLAEHAGYSLSRFKSLFREVTGQTPAQYIAMCKVEQAKKMLLLPDKNITDIAYDLGWSSSNYFCSVFKKYTGESPMRYRMLHMKQKNADA